MAQEIISMNTEHQETLLQVGDRQASIDLGIAPLIEEIWKAGIETLNSCEENRPGIIWIDFYSSDDATRFVNIVACYEEGTHCLYNRIVQYWSANDEQTDDLFWTYDIYPADLHLDQVVNEEDKSVEVSHQGLPWIEFSLSVRFPQKDYPVLLKRMKEFNERQERKRQHKLETVSSL